MEDNKATPTQKQPKIIEITQKEGEGKKIFF